jgi:hypothetical protein
MDIKGLTLILLVVVLVVLWVAATKRAQDYREYRMKVKDARSLMYVRFEVISRPATAPEFYALGERLTPSEARFVREDMKTLFRQGIVRQVEYVDIQGRVIPDTEEFQKKLKEYQDVITSKARNLGHEKVARVSTVAPYAFCREYYIAGTAYPARRLEEPTLI